MKQQLLSVKNVRNVLNQVINPLDEAEIILSKNVTSSHDFKSFCGDLRPDAKDWCLHFILTFDPSDIKMLCLNQVELTAYWIRVMKFMGYRLTNTSPFVRMQMMIHLPFTLSPIHFWKAAQMPISETSRRRCMRLQRF